MRNQALAEGAAPMLLAKVHSPQKNRDEITSFLPLSLVLIVILTLRVPFDYLYVFLKVTSYWLKS